MPDVLKTVGRYEILREVGRGGMALVYLARQTDLDRYVALKELAAFHASDAAFAQRFLRESRVAGSLSHPNIVTVHDYFEHDGTPYIAMEYIERGSLRPYVGSLSPAQIAGVLEGLLVRARARRAARDRPSRPQAREPDGDRRRARQDRRLRHRQGDQPAADRRVPDGHRHDGGHADLHGARAGHGARDRAVDRSLLRRLHGLRAVHGAGAVRRLRRADGHPPAPRQRADPAASARSTRRSTRASRRGSSDCVVKEPKERTQSAGEAWDDLEEIIIGLQGPRWRRRARLLERAPQADTPKPLTPAPFEGTEARQGDVQVVRLGNAARPGDAAARGRAGGAARAGARRRAGRAADAAADGAGRAVAAGARRAGGAGRCPPSPRCRRTRCRAEPAADDELRDVRREAPAAADAAPEAPAVAPPPGAAAPAAAPAAEPEARSADAAAAAAGGRRRGPTRRPPSPTRRPRELRRARRRVARAPSARNQRTPTTSTAGDQPAPADPDGRAAPAARRAGRGLRDLLAAAPAAAARGARTRATRRSRRRRPSRRAPRPRRSCRGRA